jgi:hypothetical protein
MNYSITKLIKAVTAITGVTAKQMKSKERKQEIVYARYLVYYFCLIDNLMIKYRMATLFRQDHATILHGIKTIRSFIETNDPLITSLITKIQNHVKNNATTTGLPLRTQIHRLPLGTLGSKAPNGKQLIMFRPPQTYLPYHRQTRMVAG